MQREANNGDTQRTNGAATDSLSAAIGELRQRPRRLWLDLIRADQSQRWRQRSGLPSELYFSLVPELLADEEEALVLIGGEVHLRREAGEQPTVEEYQRRFPQLSSAIALQFDVDRVFEAAEEPAETTDLCTLNLELSGYELLERIGSGGSGAVYRAVQKSLNRTVAIKVCPVRCAESKTLARLDQEAEILARLNHARVVQVHEVVRGRDYLYLVMEFVDGPNLQEYAAGRPLPAREAARRVLTLAEAIEKVHESGVLHRDLKPSNVLVCGDGQLKITDFGLAKLRSSDNLMTTADSFLGTPGYMAPEQATGAAHTVGPECIRWARYSMNSSRDGRHFWARPCWTHCR
jgi:predicted Ser/Thr protein kinase